MSIRIIAYLNVGTWLGREFVEFKCDNMACRKMFLVLRDDVPHVGNACPFCEGKK